MYSIINIRMLPTSLNTYMSCHYSLGRILFLWFVQNTFRDTQVLNFHSTLAQHLFRPTHFDSLLSSPCEELSFGGIASLPCFCRNDRFVVAQALHWGTLEVHFLCHCKSIRLEKES